MNVVRPIALISPFAKLPRILLLGGTLLLNSCGVQDVASVQQFVILAHQANEKYPALVADLYGSCVRAAEFDRDTLPSMQEISDRCDRFQQLQPGLLAIHQVLESYIFALGRLASNQAVAFDPEFNNLGDAIKQLPGIQSQQVDAVTKLANFLVSAGTDNYRREKLADAIGTGNSAFQETLKTLKSIFSSRYKSSLQIESDTVDGFYQEKMLTLQNNPEQLLAVRQQWQAHRALINQKLSAANSYLEILEQVGKAHQELYNKRNSLDAATINQLMVQYSYRLKPLVQNVVKAFP